MGFSDNTPRSTDEARNGVQRPRAGIKKTTNALATHPSALCRESPCSLVNLLDAFADLEVAHSQGCELDLRFDWPFNPIGMDFTQTLRRPPGLFTNQGCSRRVRKHEPCGAAGPRLDHGALGLRNQSMKFLASCSVPGEHIGWNTESGRSITLTPISPTGFLLNHIFSIPRELRECFRIPFMAPAMACWPIKTIAA